MPGKWENFPTQNRQEGEEALDDGIHEYAQEGIRELEEYLEDKRGLESIEEEGAQSGMRKELVKGFERFLFHKSERRREEGKDEIVAKLEDIAQNDKSEVVRDTAREVLDRYYNSIK